MYTHPYVCTSVFPILFVGDAVADGRLWLSGSVFNHWGVVGVGVVLSLRSYGQCTYNIVASATSRADCPVRTAARAIRAAVQEIRCLCAVCSPDNIVGIRTGACIDNPTCAQSLCM